MGSQWEGSTVITSPPVERNDIVSTCDTNSTGLGALEAGGQASTRKRWHLRQVKFPRCCLEKPKMYVVVPFIVSESGFSLALKVSGKKSCTVYIYICICIFMIYYTWLVLVFCWKHLPPRRSILTTTNAMSLRKQLMWPNGGLFKGYPVTHRIHETGVWKPSFGWFLW